MREKLQPYTGEAQLNYLCILATEIMGADSLKPILGLLTGFDSILDTLPLSTARAVRNLRLVGVAPRTLRELRLMVDGYRKFYEREARRRRRSATLIAPAGEEANEILEAVQEPRFAIDADLNVRRLWTDILPQDVQQALTMLTARLEHALQARPPLADSKKKATIISDKPYFEGTVKPLGFIPPVPPSYDLERRPRAPGFVLWADLIAIAERFDAMDVAADRQQEGQRSWFKRLHDAKGNPTAKLRKTAHGGLADCDGIELSGMVHLIGLPGAGKTTLLYLLAAYMQDKGCQSCFLFPSIEVATAFVEKLALYKVDCALLFGQGETARNKHVLNFSAALSANNGGFGVTRSVAPFFSTNCALAGFASDEEEPFPHGSPPCSSLRQASDSGKRDLKKRCALSAVCGRQHSERSLAEATIWVGHALSMDRQVSRLYTDVKIQHFDLIGHTFDLIVVDECDGTQSILDARGTPIMKIIGDSESLWSNLIRGVHAPAAGGSNAFMSSASMPDLLEKTGRFGRSTERLATSVAHLPKQFQQANANLLLTALSLLADMFVPPEPQDDTEEQRVYVRAREGLELLWDTAAKIIAFGQHAAEAGGLDEEEDDDVDFDIEQVFENAASLLAASVSQVRDFFTQLRDALASWDASGSEDALLAVAAVLRRTPNLASGLGGEEFLHYTTLLTNVSFVVIRHFGLAPHLRLLNSQGFVSDEVFESRPSKDQLAILPEALIGRLSGVRYTVSEDGDINVTHVGFAGTPRLLPHRMMNLGADHAGGGPAVLWTSATSLLQQSPSFHIHLRPDYVLQRPNAGQGWKNSKYTFFPKRDPNDDNRPIRFSGAKLSRRDAALKLMVDELLKNASLSDVEVALQSNDVVDSVGRKAGFIVNSYDQCELIYRHIISNHPRWRGRVRYLVRASFQAALPQDAVTAAEIERLGSDKEWDLLIFPMNAIGRGVNIVYQFGLRIEKAMLGSLYFLTRPHPRGDSLQLIQGIIGRASEEFDRRHFSSLEEGLQALRKSRHSTAGVIKHLLRLPLAVQSLGQYAEPFVADLMVIILQTIGRAMRGDCPAFVYFVDAAWAQRSAYGEQDTARTSMLVMMQQILKTCLSHEDRAIRECYENLYLPFYHPLTSIEGLEVQNPA